MDTPANRRLPWRRKEFFSGVAAWLAECVAHDVRYNTRRENGETRREYYERMNQIVPEMTIPDEYEYIWEWFWELNGMINRAGDGYCRPISPGDYKAWTDISGNIVTPSEYDMLRAMDGAYKRAMDQEIEDRRTRAREQAELEAASRPQMRKGRR